MSNKERARSFLNMAATGDVRAAFERFVAPDFIHHNLYFKGDRKSLLEAMEEANKSTPNKPLQIKQLFEDGNTVIAHSLVERKIATEPAIAVVHLMRFQSERIVEMWDLGVLIPKDSPNENGPF